MKRRNFLKMLGAIAVAGFVPVKAEPRYPGCATGIPLNTATGMAAVRDLQGFAYHVNDSSRTWQGINTRNYPTLTAKL